MIGSRDFLGRNGGRNISKMMEGKGVYARERLTGLPMIDTRGMLTRLSNQSASMLVRHQK